MNLNTDDLAKLDENLCDQLEDRLKVAHPSEVPVICAIVQIAIDQNASLWQTCHQARAKLLKQLGLDLVSYRREVYSVKLDPDPDDPAFWAAIGHPCTMRSLLYHLDTAMVLGECWGGVPRDRFPPEVQLAISQILDDDDLVPITEPEPEPMVEA